MITTYTPSRASSAINRLLALIAIGSASLIITASAVLFQEEAFAYAVVLSAAALTLWRPRYGLYAMLLMSIPFDPAGNYQFAQFGYYMQNPVSATTNNSMLIFSPVELILIVMALRVVVPAVVEHRPLAPTQLRTPLCIFVGLILLSVAWGIATGGVYHIALWEVRYLIAAAVIALLVPTVMPRPGQVHKLVDLCLVAAVVLSIDTIWRRFTVLSDVEYLDDKFDHGSTLFMDFAILLLVARLVWPAKGRQRLAALLIPLFLYAQMVTERRAGWVSLDIGLVLIAIFVFRLRRKVFYFIVLPLLLMYCGYLAAFWNASGAIAQPARAVRSINDPEGRDVASNISRMIERGNIRLNIRAKPITGVGFGKQYAFYYFGPDLSFWPLWHYVTHNQLMWLWMEMGPAGFITFMVLCGAGITRGVQLLKRAAHSQSAPYLVAVVSAVFMVLVFNYVDIGLMDTRMMVLFGFVLGVIGAWGARPALLEEEPA